MKEKRILKKTQEVVEMRQKGFLAFILAIVMMVLGSTAVFAQEGEITIDVEIQPILISFNIPDNGDLILNPNEDAKEARVISSDFVITSNMNASATVLVKEVKVDETAETPMTLVAPDKYEDWENVGKVIAESEFAIAVEVKDGFERNLTNETIWSTDIIEEPIEIGQIDAKQTGTITIDSFFGPATKSINTKLKILIRVELF